jgi:hypothetical protein
MQNKANSRKSQMCINTVITMNYEQRTMNIELKNKPNSNPTCSELVEPIYHGVASGEAGIYHGVASGEAGTNPISDDGRPSSFDCPLTSGLTVQGILVIVLPILCIVKSFDMFDVFSDLRQ